MVAQTDRFCQARERPGMSAADSKLIAPIASGRTRRVTVNGTGMPPLTAVMVKKRASCHELRRTR